jgi:riboflavin synthase
MFTGLVRGIGQLQACPMGVRVRLAKGDLGAMDLGDSIAVDGVCLTVAECLADGFRADASEETLRRTGLAQRAAAQALVNLEPALRLSDRLGGHLVSGHVDGVGVIEAIERQAASWRLTLAWHDASYGRYVCEKASVAVDGISLTVAGCEPDGQRFWIAVISHTWNTTTLAERRVGDPVNLEADLLAKYTERLLAAQTAAPSPPALTDTWLRGHGWS